MFNTFIDYWLLLFVSIVFYYFVGSLVLWLTNVKIDNLYASLFCRIFLGVILFVLVSALFFSKGITIMTGFLLVGSFFMMELRKEPKEVKQLNLSNPFFNKFSFLLILELFGVATFIYFIRYYFSFNLSGLPLDPHPDAVYYAKSAIFMVKTGVENCNFNFIPPIQQTTYPYHYFDLWLNGTLVIIFRIVSLTTLLLVTYTSLTFMIYVGLCAIYEKFRPVDLFAKIICLLFIFFSGSMFFNLDSIPFFSNIHVFAVNAISYPKILIIYLFLIATIIFFSYQKFIYGILSLLCLPIVFISTTPSVLSAVALCLIFFLIISKNAFFNKSVSRLLAYTVLIAIAIAGFYFLSGTKDNSYHANAGSGLISQAQNLQYWRTAFNVVAGTVIQLLVLYFIPFLGLAIFLFRSKLNFRNLDTFNGSAILLIILLFGLSLGCWALLHKMVDSVQLFSNLSIPLLHLLFFVLFAYVYSHYIGSTIISGLFLIIISFSAYKTVKKTRSPQIYSEKYLTAVYKIVGNINSVGAYIKSSGEYNTIFAKNSDFAVLGKYLSFVNSDFHQVNISVFEINVDETNPQSEVENQLVFNAAFYKFVENQKATNEFSSISESQFEFIVKHKIAYLIASKNALLNPLIKPLIKLEISDNKTGERFILLK